MGLFESGRVVHSYLVTPYRGHHEQMQQRSSVSMSKAIRSARKMRIQKRSLLSALWAA